MVPVATDRLPRSPLAGYDRNPVTSTMTRIPLDPETSVVNECCAVIYAPRRTRDRFPQGCVMVLESEQAARTAADPSAHRHAALVLGPSRSSEGQMLYYLVRWLDETGE